MTIPRPDPVEVLFALQSPKQKIQASVNIDTQPKLTL